MSDQSQEILRLQSELARLQEEVKSLQEEGLRKDRKMEHMQSVIDSLRNMMAYFRKRLFGSMSEKHLPLDPSVLQPTLFDTQLTEEEQSALDAEVKKMDYPEGVNPEEYTEIGVETTDRIAIRPAVMYIERTVRHKFVLKSSLQIDNPDRQTFMIAPMPETIIPKGMASESLLADILIDKYVYHLPFYRVIQKYIQGAGSRAE